MKAILNFLLLVAFFALGAIAYTWPGPLAIWEGRTDVFLSDGTDPTASPFQFDVIHRGLQKHPELFFYGGFPNLQLDAPEGFVAWFSFTEKLAGALFPYFIPVEQVATLLGISLLIINGLSFYALGRILSWSKILSLAIGSAWAFSVYTRTRTQVHAALSGVYIVPLAFLGISILMRDRSKKGFLLSALCFLGCATSAHYYLIYMAVFLPFLALYYFSSQEVRRDWRYALLRVSLAALPAVIFLLVSFLMPAPAEFKARVAHVLPMTGQSTDWPHPFVSTFSADVADYFSGDVAVGENDINPLRAEVDRGIRRSLISGGNFHEHAQGVRWFVWIGFVFSLVYMCRYRRRFPIGQFEGAATYVFILFGFFSFLCSITPDWGPIWGPSAWIHWLVPQIRVPNRAGIFVHFSVLMILGIITNNCIKNLKFNQKTKRILCGLFFVVLILDFPPFMNEMPMAKTVTAIASQYPSLIDNCGLGFHFPYTSGTQDSLRFYTLLQRLRGTDCAVLNSASASERDYKMALLFGYQNQELLNRIVANDKGVLQVLLAFANCNKLHWVAFDSRTPVPFTESFCRAWNGHLLNSDFCVANASIEDVHVGLPDQCLQQFRIGQPEQKRGE